MADGESPNTNPENNVITPNTEGEQSLKDFKKEFFGKSTPPDVENNDASNDNDPDPVEIAEDDDSQQEPVEDGEPDLEGDTPKAKKKTTAKERITELTAEKYEIKRQADAERAELLAKIAELEGKAVQPEQQKQEPAKSGRPDPDALNEDGTRKYPLGDIDGDYVADLTKWDVQAALAEYKAEQEAEAKRNALNEAERQMVLEWQEKVVEASKEDPDIATKGAALESTFSGIDPDYGQFLATTIMRLPYGPQVIAHLSDNIEIAEDIVASGDPITAAIRLGGLSEMIAQKKSAAQTEVKRTSNAPPPPPQTNRGTDGRFHVKDDTDDFAAFKRKFYQT